MMTSDGNLRLTIIPLENKIKPLQIKLNSTLCLERVPFRYGLIYTPKGASFDQDHRKRKKIGLGFSWSYTKNKN